ncbi:MAG: polyphenol oxidase family protein [bacterium]
MKSPAPTVGTLCDPVLMDLGVPHGFGCRGADVPASTRLPRQVHGTALWDAFSGSRAGEEPEEPAEADVVLGCGGARRSVGIVTADCVPILASAAEGEAVVAIHAGWRGLAAGVIEKGLSALRDAAGAGSIRAAIGPAARGCCYEVDEPVRAALSERYGSLLDREVIAPRRPGHFRLDLSRLAERIVRESGVSEACLGTRHRVCTICDPVRFESHRRDGARAGRLRHFITTV